MTGGLLTIDRAAVAENYRRIVTLAPTAEVAAVVKADAYGLGVAEMAPVLLKAGARTFFVALPEEGEALRRVVSPETVIYALSGPLSAPWDSTSIATLRRANVRPVLSAPEHVQAWLGGGLQAEPFALQVETGMNRLGLEPGEIPTGCHPALIMSHLACADEPQHPQNEQQRQCFEALVEPFSGVPTSLAASAGVLLGPVYHGAMVRPGIALYGGNPQPTRPNPMIPVVSLAVTITQVRRVDSAGAVGYGATHTVKAGSRLATVAVGYADGLPRRLSNRGFGVIAGQPVAMVGRVSMDLITFDVSMIPEPLARVGAAITLIGEGHGLDALADEAETIPYEILTALGSRYTRRYL